MNQPRIFTVGHGSEDFPTLAARLAPYDIGMIVDVRSVPYSRHAPDFTKDELSHLAAEFNLGYRWLGDRLGGRPSDPALQREGQTDWDALEHSDGFAAGVTELEGLSQITVVAVLCSEVDPAYCHRSTLLAGVLEQHGHPVLHVLADGSAARHQPTLDLG